MIPMSLQIFPGLAAVMIVPKRILDILNDGENTRIEAFIQFIHHNVTDIFGQINVKETEKYYVHVDDLDDELIRIIVSNTTEFDIDNLDNVEAKFTRESHDVADYLDITPSNDEFSVMYKLIDYADVEDVLCLLFDLKYSGTVLFVCLPSETYINIPNSNQRINVFLNEFAKDVSDTPEYILDLIVEAAPRCIAVDIDGKENAYRCRTIKSQKAYTRRQNRRLLKVWNRLKAYIKKQK